ncbi:glycerophosphocholine phosphodiesterase GPCPD1-like protein [Dinothrombium tinctorium]|uniref:Glycerophosphocholine phosphodiesterase GPCPD1-like protein n=1 Tax=Dinothrombium tinctorium TaxID=1965070 RepID=A0A3S4QUZ1_9ACAR|nr:glycerophosphocholine phosphodiesterase GPCPD1-like protein [Dinothrombium tinctorium]RWS08096.1 glycerophosphocholine phosphodiesterase GPCPD1-like protein [Dinothrombium tinctorium]
MSEACFSEETVIEFKISENSFTIWKRKYKERIYSYKLHCIDLQRRDSEMTALGLDENQDSTNITDNEQSGQSQPIEICALNDKEYCFTKQEQFGRVYNPNEYVMLRTQIADPSKLAFMVDIYVHDVFRTSLTVPEHIGFCYILPSNMPESYGTCTMPITGTKRQPIGQLSVEYLIIRPLKGYASACLMSPDGHLFKILGGIDVGHRGAGNARRTDKVENILENTVASFNYASNHGADMVELDVQLTKDLVPVIYHDFHINISLKKKRSQTDDEYLQIAVKDLTSQQLQLLKLSPVHNPEHKEKYDFVDDDPQENQPFPTLKQVLETVNPSCGFNIEIKYPMLRRDGTWDGAADKLCDINDYIDIVLKTVLEYGGKRKIIFSCFHPDICSMIQVKQKKYPLLFLTQGQTDKYPPYLDPRTATVQMAAYFSLSQGFLGTSVHAEDLLRDTSLVTWLKDRGLVVFCWGDDLNSSMRIKQLKNAGVDGVIYDKVDEYSPKHNQLFVAEAKEARKALIEVIAGTGDYISSISSNNSSQ